MTDARIRSGPRRARWWGPLAVAAVLVLLAGGWPLIGSWIAGDERVTAGTVFRVGPDEHHRAWFRVGSGWTLDQAATTPSRVFVLRHGDVDLSVAYISLPRSDDADALWSGLRETVRVADRHARLGPPGPVVADAGAQGMAGTLTRGGDTGRAVIYPGPDDAFAIRLIALAPPDSTDPEWLPVRDVMRSLTFTEAAA
ncbi:hypothetical protein [Embleya sp. NPDC050493]|uniref:hypothetical protein n=1 Tax=Embleya sp. NPDC050493 TaxID=3363989 RepID=UPI00379F9B14